MSFPREVLERIVFSAGEHDYRWADVVVAARAWGRWDEISVAAGTQPAEVSDSELGEAAQAFRYERSLLAADEMEAWLRHWGVTQSDWSRFLARSIVRSRQPERAGADAKEEEVWVEAVCSGELAELARDLAARVAATEANGAGPGPVETDLTRMDEALAAFKQGALTPLTRAKTLELRSADWVKLSYTAIELPDSAMASEAALCIRDDGLSLPEVAGRARVSVVERESFLEEVDPDLSKSLLSAPPGELVGPLPIENGFGLFRVNKKVAPTLEDPVIQERLEQEVPKRAVEREIRNRVQWHERL